VENKLKFIIIGLIGILVISLVINLVTYGAKEAAIRERDFLKKDNTTLAQEIERSHGESRGLEGRLNSLSEELKNATQERDELQRRFEQVNKERQELIEKLKAQQAKPAALAPAQVQVERAAPAAAPVPLTDDAYWAGILKAKGDLEMQLENIRVELKSAQINSEQLAREKSSLELEVASLRREEQDLKRQLDYNQKLMDSLAQELVMEKNDKFQIENSMKALKAEEAILRRQFKSLNSRKIALEKKFMDLQRENSGLNVRLNEAEALLHERALQMDSLKKELYGVQKGQVSPGQQKESQAPVELPPIVVRPQAEVGSSEEVMPKLVGKVLAVNRENNFVIVDLGQGTGVKVGDTFKVYRAGNVVGTLDVIQVRNDISACDINREAAPIKVGDTVR
jgi:predicted nuclease with TOPRIM domain